MADEDEKFIEDELSSDDESIDELIQEKNRFSKIKTQLAIILLVCLCNIGTGFSNDNPNALQDAIMLNINVNAVQYNLLLTFSAMPNIVMAIISGYIVECWLGPRKSIIIFCFLAFLGQGLFTLGSYFNKFPLMVVGRLVFGSAAESVSVACNTFAGIWLKGFLLTGFFSLQQSFIKTCEFLNMFYMNQLFDFLRTTLNYLPCHKNISIALCVGLAACVISVISAIILAFVDYYNSSSSRLKGGILREQEDSIWKTFNFEELGYEYWLLVFVCAATYSASTTFNGLSITFFQEKYALSTFQSSKVQSDYILISVFLSPLIGAIVGITGYDLAYLIISITLCSLCHWLLVYTYISPTIIMCVYAVATTTRNLTIWPAVSYLVPHNRLGLAYGTMQGVQNLLLTVFPIIGGKIVDTNGFAQFEALIGFLFTIAMAGLLILLASQLLYYQSPPLLSSAKQRRRIPKELT